MDFKSEIKMNATVQAGVLAPGFSVSPLTLIVKFLAVNTKLPEMAILTLKDLTAAKKSFIFIPFYPSVNQPVHTSGSPWCIASHCTVASGGHHWKPLSDKRVGHHWKPLSDKRVGQVYLVPSSFWGSGYAWFQIPSGGVQVYQGQLGGVYQGVGILRWGADIPRDGADIPAEGVCLGHYTRGRAAVIPRWVYLVYPSPFLLISSDGHPECFLLQLVFHHDVIPKS